MSYFELEFSFFHTNPHEPLAPDTQYQIRKLLAKALKSCGYGVEELHGMFDWDKDGCSCDADTYNAAERKLYITITIDYPGVRHASPIFFMTIGLNCFRKMVDDLGNVAQTLTIGGRDEGIAKHFH